MRVPSLLAVGALALVSLGLAPMHAEPSAAPLPQEGSDPSPVADAIARADKAVAAIVAVPAAQRTFDNTIGAIDDLFVRFENDTNWLRFMQYVSTDAAERARSERAEQDCQNWLIDLQKREDLYNAVKAYADTKPKLEGEQKRLLEFYLRDYKRAGMMLTPEKRAELARIEKEMARLSIEFEKNIREDEAVVPLTAAELKGMDESFLANLERSGDLYLCGLDYPTYIPIQEYCDNENTRQKMQFAYYRRGGSGNVSVLESLIKLRAQAAALLGYKNTVDYECEIRMSKGAAAVKAFYDQLQPLVREKAKLDFAELTDAKRAHTGNPNAQFQPWDFWFYQKKLLKQKFDVDARMVQEYFPFDRVMEGLFSITQSLYGLEYKDITDKAPSMGKQLWHESVRLYEVWDKATGKQLGEFYIDLFPRDNKFNHAAQWGMASRKKWADGTVQMPVAALVCNFTAPTPDKPSLMTHDEVETFFHEFGHCLHTILTEADYGRFAGTSVERDFVEAPSQMFENWVWDADVLNTFAAHYKTGEKLPRAVLDNMMAAKNLASGVLAERQFFLGLLDYNYHIVPDGAVDTSTLAQDVFTGTQLYKNSVPNTYFQCSFGHLVGYQAGYYGYQWSLVYASDMFERFKELGMLDPEAGMYYRKKILARGGTMDGLDLVRDYLGREPNLGAYLVQLGLPKDAADKAKKN